MRGHLLLLLFRRCAAATPAPPPSSLDLADPAVSLRFWLQHPSLGEAGFDSTIPHPGNPIYVGRQPWPWPVNGALGGSFRNKPTVMYLGLYQQGYAAGRHACNLSLSQAPPGGCAAAMLKLESDDHGATWAPATGGRTAQPLVCNGDPAGVDRGTGCPDGSTALDPGTGGVHLVWDWNVDLGDASVPHAGLGHSYAPPGNGCLDTGAECPGVFNRTSGSINDAVDNTPLDHGFVKLYGGTIFRRENDWLIVSAIGGGSWGMQAMSSPGAAGPYSAPQLVLWPQSDKYHPAPTEPYPAFEAGGFVYAPFTGLNSNREFQVMYRAPLERATERSAWEVVQSGSFIHWEGQATGGIWGQTFSGYVDEASGLLQMM